MNKLLVALVSLAAGITCVFNANAQTFPIKDKPVTFVVPFAAGGPTDKVARDLAEAMRKTLGTSVVVENAAGGPGGLIGAAKVSKATPDGYTVLLHHISMGVFPSLLRSLPFKVDSDFEFLGMVNEVPMTLIGRSNLPVNNYKELLTWVQTNRNHVNLANAGVASASHLCGMLWQSTIGVDLTTVPYKGTSPAMNDLLAGQVDLLCDQTTNTSSQIEAKKVKVFGVTTSKRLNTAALKDVPTLQELGQKGFQITIWHGLYAPRGTPSAVQNTLNTALRTALKDPDFIKRQEATGAVIITDERQTSTGHKAFVLGEIKKWEPIIRAASVYAD
jgi:tripartite-type tricarboxylate transporter receptor subunit TctC